jgi:hypothetical protein
MGTLPSRAIHLERCHARFLLHALPGGWMAHIGVWRPGSEKHLCLSTPSLHAEEREAFPYSDE